MSPTRTFSTRRTFLSRIALGAAAFSTPGLFAEQLLRTPRQTEGPAVHRTALAFDQRGK